MLHPNNALRPVAEGIAGPAPAEPLAEGGACSSLLHTLCEDGKQTVKVTKIIKKNCDLMYPPPKPASRYLDDYEVPPAPDDTYVTWLSQYLERKTDDD